MVKEIKSTLKLLFKIIIKPKSVIKDVTEYNRGVLNILFILLAISIGVDQSRNTIFNTPLSIFIGFPIGIYLLRKWLVLCYLILFKFGISKKITYKELEKLLLPYIFLYLIAIRLIPSTIPYDFNSIKFVIRLFASLWFFWQIYLINKYKFNQRNLKSIILASINPLIALIYSIYGRLYY